MSKAVPRYWPSARHFTEAIQCPGVSFSNHLLRETLPAIDRLGMPLVTSGQFAYVYKLKSKKAGCDFAVRCFRGYLGDRDQRYRAIQKHIQAHPLPFISGFTYEPHGILVGGARYPILFMKWIDGPTLDLYLEEMMGRREVLLHLAEEWVKLVRDLHEAHIAHGDLQHGNIIVEHGRLRLVDHDGMFVPKMTGWKSSELGHQHYQHPRRDEDFFEESMDNFSALVIYLSLISLAEEPGLWAEHHDENLLFTKQDFLNPAASTLFTKIKLLGEEPKRLAEILEEAARGEPSAVPSLTELVEAKSALPAWMNAPLNLEAKTKTREVKHTTGVMQAEGSRWIPWQARMTRTSSLPSTPASSTVQTIFGGSAKASAVSKIRDPHDLWRNTPILAKELLSRTFLWWYWSIYFFLKIVGLDFFYSMLLALSCVAVICLTYGFVRALELAHDAQQAKLFLNNPTPQTSLPSYNTAPLPAPRVVRALHDLYPSSITTTDAIIANRVLSIYHLPTCQWVEQISPKNIVGFPSPAEALSAGYKPCRVCLS
jgi:hypothetical protein